MNIADDIRAIIDYKHKEPTIEKCREKDCNWRVMGWICQHAGNDYCLFDKKGERKNERVRQ